MGFLETLFKRRQLESAPPSVSRGRYILRRKGTDEIVPPFTRLETKTGAAFSIIGFESAPHFVWVWREPRREHRDMTSMEVPPETIGCYYELQA
jgi:hypothetical protein